MALESLLLIRLCSHVCIRMQARTHVRTHGRTHSLTHAREQWQRWWKSCWILRRRPCMTSQRDSSSSSLVLPLACMSYEEDSCMSYEAEGTCMSASRSSALVLPLAPHTSPSPIHWTLSGAGSARYVRAARRRLSIQCSRSRLSSRLIS